jgi:metal-responsive CopG/Arc/MetJ family transcriptional regulator
MEVFNMALRRIVMNLDEDLVKRIDSYAERLHINRTAAASVLLSSAAETQEFLTHFPELMKAYQEEQEKQERGEEK